MKNQELYQNVLSKTNLIALATSVENKPNVRLVNFCSDANKPGILFFATDRGDHKIGEFAQNNRVSFTTVPNGGEVAHVRSAQATVQKSQHSLQDLAALFVAQVPGYDETIKEIGRALDVYEIRVEEAVVISGFDAAEVVSF